MALCGPSVPDRHRVLWINVHTTVPAAEQRLHMAFSHLCSSDMSGSLRGGQCNTTQTQKVMLFLQLYTVKGNESFLLPGKPTGLRLLRNRALVACPPPDNVWSATFWNQTSRTGPPVSVHLSFNSYLMRINFNPPKCHFVAPAGSKVSH